MSIGLRNLICERLNIPASYVNKIAKKASYSYRRYEIAKKNSDNKRTIYHPSKPLKGLQRFLLHQIISNWKIHECATAYKTGSTIYENAFRHRQSRYFIRLDLNNFFESLTRDDISNFLNNECEDWDHYDKKLFLDLVCRLDRLTIGAPTSPMISNALCFKLDKIINDACENNNCIYTRYSDDIFISTQASQVLDSFKYEVMEMITDIDLPGNLSINSNKTLNFSTKNRCRITGLNIGSDKLVHVPRSTKRYIRSCIYNYSSLNISERNRLAGLINYVQSIDTEFLNKLYLKYEQDVVDDAIRIMPT